MYAQSGEAAVGHLRTKGGQHEVDFIVSTASDRVVAFEVKLSTTVDDQDVSHLRWLGEGLCADLLDAVVITTGRAAYRRKEGIAVVPAALLGPQPVSGSCAGAEAVNQKNMGPDPSGYSRLDAGPAHPERSKSRCPRAIGHVDQYAWRTWTIGWSGSSVP